MTANVRIGNQQKPILRRPGVEHEAGTSRSADDGSTDNTNYVIAQPPHLIGSFGPVEHGLMLVTHSCVPPNIYARRAVEQFAQFGNLNIGALLPSGLRLISVTSGNHRHHEQAKAIRSNSQSDMTKYRHIDSGGQIDWCSDAGLHTLHPFLDQVKGGVVSIEQPSACPIASSHNAYLLRIHMTAKEKGCWVMLFATAFGKQASWDYAGVCGERIEVASCEPEPGAFDGLSIGYTYLRHLHVYGFGKALCSIFESEGRLDFRYDPFVAANLETRVMWLLRQQKKSLQEIGSILKRNGATVYRRLQGLPPAAERPLSQRRMQPYLDIYDRTE